MAAEVVGTAFVRIRAITTGLAKEIEQGVKKGVDNANLEKAGASGGEHFAKGAADKIHDGIKKATGDAEKDIDVDGARRGGDKYGNSFLGGFRESLARTRSRLGNIFDRKDGEEDGRNYLSGLGDIFSRDGGKSGSQAASGFSRGFRGILLKAALIGAPVVTGAISALLQYVVSLVGQIGYLATAIAGLGSAGLAAFGAIGLSALPITLAFKAPTKALESFQETLKDVGHQWLAVGASTQQTLLVGLKYAAKLSTKMIPTFNAFGREIGKVVSDFAIWNADMLFTGDGLARMRDILRGSVPIVRSLGFFFGNMLDVLLNLWHSSIPAAQDFARTLADISYRLQETVSAASASGALTTTISEWYARGKLVVGALADIWVGLWNIFKIGADNSVSFFTTFDNFAARFRAFTESAEGQNRLANIFKQANAVAHEFNGLISDIISRISGEVFDAGGAEGIIGFIRYLRHDVVPFLDTLITGISSSYGPALQDLATTFSDVLRSFAESGGLAITLETLTTTLQIFNTVLKALLDMPGGERFIGTILGLAGAFGVLKLLGVTKLLGGIGGGVLGLTRYLLQLDKATKKGAVIKAAFAPGALATAGTTIAGLASTLGGFVVAAAPFILAAAAIAGIAYLIYRNWDTIKEVFSDVYEFVRRNFVNIGQIVLIAVAPMIGIPILIIRNWDRISAFFSRLPGIVGRFLGRAAGMFTSLGGRIVSALAGIGSSLLGAFTSAFIALITALPGLFLNVFVFFVTLPFRILGLLVQLGAILVASFLIAVTFLIAQLPGMWNAAYAFFTELPGRIISQLAEFGNMLLRVFSSAWETVASALDTGWDAVFSFFTGLPDRVIGFITALPGRIAAVFTDVFRSAQDIVGRGINNVIEFFTGLPGRITSTLGNIVSAAARIGRGILDGIGNGLAAAGGFVSDLASQVQRALRGVVNRVIDGLNDALPDSLGVSPFKVDLPKNPIPKLGAMGGIFRRATNMIIGEAGTEALLPITRPNVMRALLRDNPAIARAILGAMPDLSDQYPPAAAFRETASTKQASAIASSVTQHIVINEVANDPELTAYAVAARLGAQSTR